MHLPSYLRRALQEYLDGATSASEFRVEHHNEEQSLAWFLDVLSERTDTLPAGYCSQFDIPVGSTYAEDRKAVIDDTIAAYHRDFNKESGSGGEPKTYMPTKEDGNPDIQEFSIVIDKDYVQDAGTLATSGVRTSTKPTGVQGATVTSSLFERLKAASKAKTEAQPEPVATGGKKGKVRSDLGTTDPVDSFGRSHSIRHDILAGARSWPCCSIQGAAAPMSSILISMT